MSLSNDARDMGQLLSYALRPKMRPGVEGEYGRLLRRCQDEMSFRDAFNDLLEGMQLRVLHAGDLGVVLTAMAWTATSWLDESLRSVVAAVLSAGTRIAQESVGYEALVSFPVWW